MTGKLPERVWDEKYWQERWELSQRVGQKHHAVFRCGEARWREIENKHREILARHIKEHDSVLDCGCGWGRLLELLPDRRVWSGPYMGVDLSPRFIHVALTEMVPRLVAKRQAGAAFTVGKLEELSRIVPLFVDHGGPLTTDPGEIDKSEPIPPPPLPRKWDWAVMVSVRPMIIRNQGQEAWDGMEREIRKVANRLLYLEYDPFDEGSVE